MGSFKEIVDKITKSSKLSNLFAIVLVLILVFITLSFFDNKPKPTSSNVLESENENQDEVKANETLAEYETRQKKELKEMIEQMDGVGKVDVKIYFESGEVKVPATDDTTQTSTTEEKDTSGGTRVTKSQNDGSKVVMGGGVDGNSPLIVKVDKPKISGIIVVAEGAENSEIRYSIGKACSTLFDISADKVQVFAMKKSN